MVIVMIVLNFVSQCLIAGGFSTSGCEMALGRGGTFLNVEALEKCLKQKGWNSSNKVPSGGFPIGGVITFNNGQHSSICVQGGNVPLIASHSPNEWMGNSNWGWARNYYGSEKVVVIVLLLIDYLLLVVII